MPSEEKKHKKRMQFRHNDEEIDANALAKTIASEHRSKDETLQDIPVTPANYQRFQGDRNEKRLPRGIKWGIAGLVAIFIVGFIVSYYVVRERVVREISSQVTTLQQGVSDLQNLDPQSAQSQFQNLDSTPDLSGLESAFGFLFKGSSQAFQSFGDMSKWLSALATDSGTLQSSTFQFFATGDGTSFVANLTSIKNDLSAIDADSNSLGAVIPSLNNPNSPNQLASAYLPLKAQVEGAEQFLNNFIPWLQDPNPHHVLVMLQNPSEERPGGGFLGSYADITIASATVTNIAIHDVSDVDLAFTPNIVPPVPLQLETTRFRPADANWFFDFPTSAAETISFFEQSNLYAASGTTFDAAVAISPKVITDLLGITGPITIGTGKNANTFSADNFLVQTQKIVQNGQATGATYPKQILRSLAQALVSQLATDAQNATTTSTSTPSAATTSPIVTLPAAASTIADTTSTQAASSSDQELLSLALNWIHDKDIMMYFKDPDFENFVKSYGAAGDVYQLPQNFNGDYLAVVNADINADKSELYVQQSVNFDAEIGADGTVTDHLIIDRNHEGNQSPYWWYQTTNQDYLQVFVSPASSLSNESGGITRTVPPPINYVKDGYSTDPTVVGIETSTIQLFAYPAVITQQQFGKEVFGLWSRVQKGATTEIVLDYTHHLFSSPADGVQYQFVFEKQAGATGSYQFEVDAPLGYVFAENNLASYTYSSDDPPGRMVVTLTLQKLSNY